MPVLVILAVALSIAVTCSLFAVADGLLLRPLPFSRPDELVAIRYRQVGGRPPGLAYLPEFADARQALQLAIETSPLVRTTTQAGFQNFFRSDQQAELGLRVTGIDARFFGMLGLAPAAGVDFSSDDERSPATTARSLTSESPLPVILGDGLARRLFGASTTALGDHLLAGREVRVVGVMPPGVKFPGETNVWAPVRSDRLRLPAYARLHANATAAQLAQLSPELEVLPLRDAVSAGGSRAVLVLLVAAVLLLILTWVQVAALSLSRAIGHLDEIKVRAALGASRAQLCRPVLIHNAFLAMASLAVAWLAIPALTSWVIRLLPTHLQVGQYLDANGRTLAFSAALSLAGLIIVTVGPAAVLRRVISSQARETRLIVSGANRWRRILLVGQMTLTALLLYLAGLALNSFARVTVFDYGFDIKNVLLFTPPSWTTPGESRDSAVVAFKTHSDKVQRTIEMLDEHPLVMGVAGFFAAPLGVGLPQELLPVRSFAGRPAVGLMARPNSVSSGFIGAFGARIVAGRPIDRREVGGSTRLVLINETLAKQLMPSGSGGLTPAWPAILGRDIQTSVAGGTIIGVISDFVQTAPDRAPEPEFYVFDERAEAFTGVALRIRPRDERSIRAALERAWGPLSPNQLRWMHDEQERVLAPYRAQFVMLGLIAAFCLPIAALGLAGALAQAVQARTREIAIRLAVGADPSAVRRMILSQALVSVGAGIVLGTAIGSALATVIASQLFHVGPTDATTMVLVAAGLMSLAWVIALAPARRGASVNPSLALKDS